MTAIMRSLREQSLRELDDFLADYGRTVPSKVLNVELRRLALDALKRIVNRTPVGDTGLARGNWQVTIDEPATGTLDVKDKSGGEAQARAKAALASLSSDQYFGKFPTVWITNNLPYILVLEEGGYPNPSKKEQEYGSLHAEDVAGLSRKGRKLSKKKRQSIAKRFAPRTRGGFSLQAPAGMVAITLQELVSGLRGQQEAE